MWLRLLCVSDVSHVFLYGLQPIGIVLSLDAFFFFIDPATTEIYTLSLHDALPISRGSDRPDAARPRRSRGPCSRTADRKSTRLNSSHTVISYAVFCLKKKKSKTPEKYTQT